MKRSTVKRPNATTPHSMLAQPAPVAELIRALINISCMSHSLAASRDDLDRFPRNGPFPEVPRAFKDYLAVCRARAQGKYSGSERAWVKGAKEAWTHITREVADFEGSRAGLLADYGRWCQWIEDALGVLPKIAPLLVGLEAQPLAWTSRLRKALYRVRSVRGAAGDRPWVVAAKSWTAHLQGIDEAREYLQTADFSESMKPIPHAGWVRQELCREGGIKPTTFDRIREAAGVPAAKPGDHSRRYGRGDLKKLIAAARSGKFPRLGPEAVDGWSILLGET